MKTKGNVPIWTKSPRSGTRYFHYTL